MGRTGMYWEAPIVAGASMHAVARWHARSLVNTPEALILDLGTLARVRARPDGAFDHAADALADD